MNSRPEVGEELMNAVLTNRGHVYSSRQYNSTTASHSTSKPASGETFYQDPAHQPSDQPSNNESGDSVDSMNAFDSIEVLMNDGDVEEQSSFIDNGVQ